MSELDLDLRLAPTIEQDTISAALCVVEQLDECRTLLEDLASRMIGQHQAEAQAIAAKLGSLLTILDSEHTNLTIAPAVETAFLASTNLSVVERLGLSGELLRLREESWSITNMARHFGLTAPTIARFLKYYDSLQPTKKAKLRRVSVFDTTEQLEMLMVNINQQLARLQGSNDEVAVKYTAELRQTIQLAATMAEKMANYHAYQTFMKSVVGILLNELPDKRDDILAKIKLVGKSQELFSPYAPIQ